MNAAKKIEIPHIKQLRESSCGAAVLSMIYNYWGVRGQTEDIIWNRLKEPRKNVAGECFLRTIPMAKDSERFNLSYFYGQSVMNSFSEAIQPIKEFLNLSIPVVVCQRISKENELGHFRIVTGFSDDYVSVSDPLLDKSEEKISTKDFMFLWSDAKNGEVVGGEFFAIFDKAKLNKENRFTVTNFNSSVQSFDVSNLKFI